MHLKPNVTNASSVTICINLDYEKSGKICSYQPSANASKCCLKFINERECEKCVDGFVLKNGKCIDVKIPGCLEKSIRGDCVNCASSYALWGGKCLEKI